MAAWTLQRPFATLEETARVLADAVQIVDTLACGRVMYVYGQAGARRATYITCCAARETFGIRISYSPVSPRVASRCCLVVCMLCCCCRLSAHVMCCCLMHTFTSIIIIITITYITTINTIITTITMNTIITTIHRVHL